MSDQHRVVEFEGFDFPVWAVAHTEAAGRGGVTALTTHHLVADTGERNLPLFRAEEYAAAYIAHRKLGGCAPTPIPAPAELAALLDDFLAQGECDVRFDDAYGPTPGTICYSADQLVRFIREQFPDA